MSGVQLFIKMRYTQCLTVNSNVVVSTQISMTDQTERDDFGLDDSVLQLVM